MWSLLIICLDILSDEASVIAGSLEYLQLLYGDAFGLYEPIHGSAPEIAGLGIRTQQNNPFCCYMLQYSFGMKEEAAEIERAVNAVLKTVTSLHLAKIKNLH